MGYRRTVTPILHLLDLLQSLYKNRKDHKLTAEDPKKLRFQLYEAIYASKHHDQYKHFAQLKVMYSFILVGTELHAIFDRSKKFIDTAPDKISKYTNSSPFINARGIVQDLIARITLDETTEEAYYSSVSSLPDTELIKLDKWAEDQGWSLIHHGEKGITLTKREIPLWLRWRRE